MAVAEETSSQRRLVLACTHLFWNPKFPDVKAAQASLLVKQVRCGTAGSLRNGSACTVTLPALLPVTGLHRVPTDPTLWRGAWAAKRAPADPGRRLQQCASFASTLCCGIMVTTGRPRDCMSVRHACRSGEEMEVRHVR